MLVLSAVMWVYFNHVNRTLIEFEIHINKQAIYLSTYSEPPQFAIWLENPKNGRKKQIFVTNRVGIGDWEGKADVPSAIPHWVKVFRNSKTETDSEEVAVSGATPKDEYFRIDANVKAGSEWIVWLEVNLAGDYNEYYPQINRITHEEDEFACGQPALLYRADINAIKGNEYKPEIVAMSLWEAGKAHLTARDSTITSAHTVFDEINIRVVKPKFRLINLKKADNQKILKT
ncbi:MAG: hypothetical protein LBS54_06800 [Dysgonamonadaceae bacterium]|jgi:hypothetical protein|nr:hypothetical protein [Dysgonamonadaceae bacterium]